MVQLPNIAPAKLVDRLRDAAFVSIGFGVLAFQSAQVQRRRLTRQLNRLLSDLA
jgi:hypothetical protein